MGIIPVSTKDTMKRLQLVMAASKNYSAYRTELARRVDGLLADETESEEAEIKKSQIE